MQHTTNEKAKEPKSTAIDSYPDFDQAIRMAQVGDLKNPYIEVSKKFFEHLTKGQNTPYLTYGSPGVKVFIEGTRAEIEARERDTAENVRELEIKAKSQAMNR